MLQHLHDVRAQELESEGVGSRLTLIELMVVLLIIAILLAIAIPTFLGVTGSANDRAAQSNLTNAMTEANAVYQNNGRSLPTAAASYQSAAPEFSWISGAVASTNVGSGVSVGVSADMYVEILGTWSSTNTCWYGLMSRPKLRLRALAAAAALTQGTYYHAQTGVPRQRGAMRPLLQCRVTRNGRPPTARLSPLGTADRSFRKVASPVPAERVNEASRSGPRSCGGQTLLLYLLQRSSIKLRD